MVLMTNEREPNNAEHRLPELNEQEMRSPLSAKEIFVRERGIGTSGLPKIRFSVSKIEAPVDVR